MSHGSECRTRKVRAKSWAMPGFDAGTAAFDEVEVRPEAHAADDDNVAQLIGGLAAEMDRKVHVVQPRV